MLGGAGAVDRGTCCTAVFVDTGQHVMKVQEKQFLWGEHKHKLVPLMCSYEK